MTSDLTAHSTQDRDQVLRLIDFLAEYDAQRNKPVRNIADYRLFRLDESSLPNHPAVRLAASEEKWLAVDFIDLPPAPPIPSKLEGVLDDGTTLSPTRRPTFTAEPPAPPARNLSETDAEQAEAAYADELAAHEALATAAESWINENWEPWSQRHHAASTVKNLHRELFEQRERLVLERESVELVWGFGRARWDVDGYSVDHPLLTVPVEVDLNPKSQEISICPAGDAEVEVHYTFGLDLHDRASLNSTRTAVTELELDPWNAIERGDVLKSLTRALDDNGTVASTLPKTAGENLVTADTWTLYLRRRVPDSQGFLRRMREIYLDGGTIPAPLADVVASPAEHPGAAHDDAASSSAPAQPPLLPLPANDEQRRILELAQKMPGVTVQGPPGTGKSHTIANLVSHYVAYGQRVLVVSEKEQALKVLSDKIPEGIRDLTVSVLGADTESRKALERAVSTIQERVGRLDEAAADAAIERYRRELDETDRGLAQATTDMLRARQAEVETADGEWLAGADPTPQAAAVWVRANQSTLGFVPDTLDLSAGIPLTKAEYAEYLRLLGSVEATDALAALAAVPNPGDLPTLVEVGHLWEVAADGDTAADGVRHAFADWQRFSESDRSRIVKARESVAAFADVLAGLESSSFKELVARLDDALLVKELEQYTSTLVSLREQAMAHRTSLMAHTVEFTEPATPDSLAVVQQARDKLGVSGKLGMFDGRLKKALAAYTVNGQPARSAVDAALAADAVSLELARAQLVRVYTNQPRAGVARILSVRPENDIADEIDTLRVLMSLPGKRHEVATELYELGVRYDRLGTSAEASALAGDLQKALRHFEAKDARAELAALESTLKAGTATLDASPLWLQFLDALQTSDRDAWARLRDEAARLVALLEPARRLRELGTRLAAVAPSWAKALEQDPASAPAPDLIEAGWQWRQLDCWISGVANLPTPAELQARVDELGRNRRRTVSRLVEELAWRRLKGNLGPKQHQALQSYVQAVKKYGKTGGKYAARWTQIMREALNESKDAVPVWVMTTSRALMSFQPDAVPTFDVLIIDEASQIGFEALPLLALAKRAIVVGDDKQTSPEHVGLDRQKVFDILDDHLTSVHGYKSLFDPDNSLYDLAAQKFSSPVMLSEHFRCLPEIIAFSSDLSYNGRIVPLRDQAPSPGWAPLGVVRVKDGYRQGDVNKPEAEQVVALVNELVADPAYDGMTFGVVSLLGSSQSKLIWDRLYEELGPEEFEARAIRCGEAPAFQGDERDVIIVTTVVAVDPLAPTTRFGAMTKESERRRINVAASRARNQMWVVTSVDPGMLPQGDFRAGLIQHCSGYIAHRAEQDELLAACESEFERRVVTDLVNRGFTGVEVQKKVGQYRLDIVVSGPERRLAIECDGDRWHGPDVWHQDRTRQEVLERAGWTFERIRGSAYYRDPESAMAAVWAHLAELGIPTGDEWRDAPARTMVREVSGTPEPVVTAPEGAMHDGGAPGRDIDVPQQPAAIAEGPDLAEAQPQNDFGDFSDLFEQLEDELADTFQPESADEPDLAGEEISDQPSLLPAGVIKLQPYVQWSGRPLAQATPNSLHEVEAGLVEIVRVEGPMIAREAYLRYQQATGGSRVGKALARLYNKAANAALRDGRIGRLNDGLINLTQATLYVPGQEPVVLRELGPRTIYDVPKSEIVVAFEQLMSSGIDHAELDRELLRLFELKRLTGPTIAFLNDAKQYRWQVR
ncbi:AAA domain-containing protein [Sinomonas flava]|uniref:AAA domain-containing protein n=1 Tax=Sinomonas flava TaxID=496857 RepID=A0ABN3BT83_9MICC